MIVDVKKEQAVSVSLEALKDGTVDPSPPLVEQILIY